MTTTIAVLGSGKVGSSLAAGLASAGREVLIGSGDPQRRRASDDALRTAGVRIAGRAEAAGAAGIVVNTMPGEVSVDLLRQLEPELRGKILVDVSNAAERGPQGFPTVLLYPGSSLAEAIQQVLPQTSVVKALNTMDHTVMVGPRSLSSPVTAFVAGDDAEAKAVVAALLADLGWPADWVLDIGGTEAARVIESAVLMLGPFVTAHGYVPFGLAIAR